MVVFCMRMCASDSGIAIPGYRIPWSRPIFLIQKCRDYRGLIPGFRHWKKRTIAIINGHFHGTDHGKTVNVDCRQATRATASDPHPSTVHLRLSTYPPDYYHYIQCSHIYVTCLLTVPPTSVEAERAISAAAASQYLLQHNFAPGSVTHSSTRTHQLMCHYFDGDI